MTDRNLNDLHPVLRTLATQFLTKVNAAIAPSKAAIVVTWRDGAAQDAAHAAGLSKAGSGHSPHNVVTAAGFPASCAFDFAVFDPEGTYITDGHDLRYTTAGGVAVGMGLEWAGDWTVATDGCGPDYDHVELKNWRQYLPTSSAPASA